MKQVPKYLLIGDSSLYCKGISNRAKKQYVDKHLKDYSGGAFELTCCHCDGDGIEGIFQKLGKISGIFDKIFVSYFGNFLSEKDKQGGAEKKKEIFNKFFDLLKSKCPTQTIVWWVGGFSLKYGYKNGHIYDENMSKVREWIRRGGMECVTNFEMVAKFTMGNAEHVHSDNSEELCDFWLDVFNGKIHDRYRGVHPDSFDHKLADPLPTNARVFKDKKSEWLFPPTPSTQAASSFQMRAGDFPSLATSTQSAPKPPSQNSQAKAASSFQMHAGDFPSLATSTPQTAPVASSTEPKPPVRLFPPTPSTQAATSFQMQAEEFPSLPTSTQFAPKPPTQNSQAATIFLEEFPSLPTSTQFAPKPPTQNSQAATIFLAEFPSLATSTPQTAPVASSTEPKPPVRRWTNKNKRNKMGNFADDDACKEHTPEVHCAKKETPAEWLREQPQRWGRNKSQPEINRDVISICKNPFEGMAFEPCWHRSNKKGNILFLRVKESSITKEDISCACTEYGEVSQIHLHGEWGWGWVEFVDSAPARELLMHQKLNKVPASV